MDEHMVVRLYDFPKFTYKMLILKLNLKNRLIKVLATPVS